LGIAYDFKRFDLARAKVLLNSNYKEIGVYLADTLLSKSTGLVDWSGSRRLRWDLAEKMGRGVNSPLGETLDVAKEAVGKD